MRRRACAEIFTDFAYYRRSDMSACLSFLVQKFSLAHPRPPFSLKPSPKPGFDQQCIPLFKNVWFDGSFNVSGLAVRLNHVKSNSQVHVFSSNGVLIACDMLTCFFFLYKVHWPILFTHYSQTQSLALTSNVFPSQEGTL